MEFGAQVPQLLDAVSAEVARVCPRWERLPGWGHHGGLDARLPEGGHKLLLLLRDPGDLLRIQDEARVSLADNFLHLASGQEALVEEPEGREGVLLVLIDGGHRHLLEARGPAPEEEGAGARGDEPRPLVPEPIGVPVVALVQEDIHLGGHAVVAKAGHRQQAPVAPEAAGVGQVKKLLVVTLPSQLRSLMTVCSPAATEKVVTALSSWMLDWRC
mmetsp:Transcript_75524/g.233655  ORF Transcript_75524/g.233655 Transcript_75524/m.233655 type:complete len:215 (-) Transcript_75524:262-906(-)